MSEIIDVSWDMLDDTEENNELIEVDSALINSLSDKAKVDIDYISDLSGETKDDVISKLKGAIYQNPVKSNGDPYQGFELDAEYLSGNLYQKLQDAIKYDQMYHTYGDNIKVLREVMPLGVSVDKIYYSLSSPWISFELMFKFIEHLYNIVGMYGELNEYTLRRDDFTKKYELNFEYWTLNRLNIHYGTGQKRINEILLCLLNNKSIKVFNLIDVGKKYKKQVLNKAETILAQNIATKLNEDFHKFIESSLINISTLQEDYNKLYGYNKSRIYDGSFLTFPNLNKNEHLFNYQKNAVARILFNHNTLLAHNVGAGKTYIMASAGEELLRTKLSKKNLYVVPNSITVQWKNIYLSLYNNANILVIEAKDFTPAKKIKTLEKIKNFTNGSIIMPYSVFDKIHLSKGIELQKLYNKLAAMGSVTDPSHTTKTLEKERLKIQDRIAEIKAEPIDPLEDYTFDKLEIDRLFLDEAHNYKNIQIETSYDFDTSVTPNPSSKCIHLMDVCDYLNHMQKGIIFATGTPITNSISDCYAMQRYLQPGELKLLDLFEFREWIGMFAELTEEIEVDVDTNQFRTRTRYSKFHNLTELTQILSNICDFHFNKNDKGLPTFNGYDVIELDENKEIKTYLNTIAKRIEDIRSSRVSRKDDNMLKVTIDSRKAALDLRLIDSNKYSHISYNKVFECADKVYEIYQNTKDDKLTQLIFCDSSTPKDDFNVYSEMKQLLVSKGVSQDEIEFIHDATTDLEKEELFKKVNNGEVRILIGSTFKLGTGVNVQRLLYAIHHLDIPWRPSDMVQREGRILRPGNTNQVVHIYKYIQKGSFDSYSWQLLEIKQNFINELLSNSLTQRSLEDVEDTKLNYAEAKALAVGNPKIKDLLVTSNELNRLKLLAKREEERIFTNKTRIITLKEQVSKLNNEISDLKLDVQTFDNNNVELSEEERSKLRNKIWDNATSQINDEDLLISYYKGFDIYAPKHIMTNQKRVDIKGFGTYHVFLETNLGTLTKIDNFLENLHSRLEKKEKELINKKDTIKTLEESLLNKTSDTDRISELENKLELLNKSFME